MFECDITQFNRPLLKQMPCVIIGLWNNRVTARALASHIVHRMGGGADVFQFSRPYGFGLLIIALLTFIFNNSK